MEYMYSDAVIYFFDFVSECKGYPIALLRPSSDAELFISRTNSNLDRSKLTKVRLLIQTSNFIRRT